MTAPGTPEARIEPHEEEVVLRLGDILPRVPDHLLKPGPHDRMKQLRFSVDELAEKISRGRASVPVERLAAACPEVFIGIESLSSEPEIQLPLQKLLEQVGLIAPKPPAPNGIPPEHVEQARAEATRIINTEEQKPEPAAPTTEKTAAEAEKAEKPASPARRFLGLFTRANVNKSQSTIEETVVDKSTVISEKEKGVETKEKAPAEAVNKSAPAPIPAGYISLRVIPIFRLLPSEVIQPGRHPAEEARVALPLAAIDPQLASGHVEIPLEEFIKALPEAVKSCVIPKEGVNAWIPLDEIFQNLPTDHLFYMPPYKPVEEPAAPASEAPAVESPAPAITEAAPAKPEPVAEPAQTPKAEAAPQRVAENTPTDTPTDTPPQPPAAEKPAEPAPEPQPVEAAAPASEPAPAPAPAPEPALDAPKNPEPQPSRAPWMRGFQVPPPRLFADAAPASSIEPPPANSQESPSEPAPAPAATPEARRTADHLASQPGIFAAAAFVEGAVFASADFPRKPDLDALRDFVGNIVGLARESGRQLGWSRVLTIACDQFHATAVVRDTHFIVALHHDRTLPPVTHDALMGAGDDLGKETSVLEAPKPPG